MERNVPAEIENHPAFKGFNTGCCGRLIGSMAWVTVFVSDAKSYWDAASETKYKESEERAIRFLMNSGGAAAGLHIAKVEHLRVSLPFQEKRDEYRHAISEAIFRLGYRTFKEMRASICQNLSGVEHIAVFFVFNKKNRSFAAVSDCHKSISSTRRSHAATDEFSVIYAGSSAYLHFVICHELLHLYGAMDYYYPALVKREADKCFLHSIMLDFGGVIHIDELTKYLVGWNTILTPKSIEFLKKTIITRRPINVENMVFQNPPRRRIIHDNETKGE